MSVWFTYLTCVAMAFAFIAVWLPWRFYRQPLWFWLLLTAVILALPAHLLTPLALLWISIALVACYLVQRRAHTPVWMLLLLAVYLFALGLGVLPGFARITLIEPALIGDGVTPYGLRVSLAKPIAGLLVLAWLAPRCRSWREVGRLALCWPRWLLPALAVLLFAGLLGVAVDVKWLWWTPLFILLNTLFTVIPEEAFFRTFFQHPLEQRWGNAGWILWVVGALFALAHVVPIHADLWRPFAVILAAGVAYAWAYRQSGRIETAVLAHMAVNSLHFVLLVYPMTF
ncbi:lysostaphin resistance A-like protein [Cellvibrio sp. ARAG 10.3]|uniref:CPBP family intramembrane glutamic endopeptidase n=1 Tax=Cellvibrio sp. ARAG 10.3 TaxID=3451358 RepID=UPI003F48A4A4